MEQQSSDQEQKEAAESPEEQRIREGIADALRNGESIDHETACLIANAITPGSGDLHLLATTGEVGLDIGVELDLAAEVLPERADTWIAALDGYCYRRRDKGPLPGWQGRSEVTDEGGPAHDD